MSTDRNDDYLLVAPPDKGNTGIWISGEHLKQILARALNTWDNAPAEVKELHDVVVHGWVMQDYKKMAAAEEPTKLHAEE